MLNYQRYKRVPVINYPERQWPYKEIEKAPIWCSVDLRDGNQALIEPMVVEEKIEMFNLLVKLGFKEIEIGFPAASQIEFDFLRQLVERKLIPDDVVVQVLVQCREHLIKRTFEAIQGIKKAIVHIYNSTSTLQRDVVFHKSKEEIKDIAVEGTEMVKKYMDGFDGEVILEYSPESFTGTELDFALDICTAVQDTWGATPEKKIIINLPSTVEMTTPNVYADQIEWMDRHFKNRDSIILSVHPHNDRGTGIAATELALLAGADRVEGTLLGNGERTGNVDILTVAYNMFSQGINPELNLENVREIVDVCERCTKMEVEPRHPYAGKLVFTAFSGSHQDAINKGMQAMHERNQEHWEVPYLPMTRRISADSTNQSCASTASPARAAWRSSWIHSMVSGFRRECTRNLPMSFRRFPRSRVRLRLSRSWMSSRETTASARNRSISVSARLQRPRTIPSSQHWPRSVIPTTAWRRSLKASETVLSMRYRRDLRKSWELKSGYWITTSTHLLPVQEHRRLPISTCWM